MKKEIYRKKMTKIENPISISGNNRMAIIVASLNAELIYNLHIPATTTLLLFILLRPASDRKVGAQDVTMSN